MHNFGFFFGNGAPITSTSCPNKTDAWFFSGQKTNTRRKAAIAGMKHARPIGVLNPTEGFGQGFEDVDYIEHMGRAWFAPAPSGPYHVDTFRAYEALEHGCIPIVDGRTPAGRMRYWQFAFDEVPFPIIEDWDHVGGMIEQLTPRRHFWSARCSAWWQQRKREMAWRLRNDLTKLGFELPEPDPVTVIITTSPSPQHPSLDMIQETVASARHYFPTSEIIIACDGVRPEQEHLRDQYEEYLFDLCRWTEHQQHDIIPYVAEEWRHQAMLTFDALVQLGHNEVLLFMEHDTPLVTDEPIDMAACVETVRMGMLDVLRFHHEAHILKPHEHLMVDHQTVDIAGLPVRRTRQWSQRPHLASGRYYTDMLGTYFTNESRTMIEDRIHGVCQSEPWARHRLAIYHPEGNIKRSYHLDGRGSEDKFGMVY
jgi:hypothetical protein